MVLAEAVPFLIAELTRAQTPGRRLRGRASAASEPNERRVRIFGRQDFRFLSARHSASSILGNAVLQVEHAVAEPVSLKQLPLQPL
jgi:hypothetical protein